MFASLLFSLLCAVCFYCLAFESALPVKRWAVVGFVLGPLALPLLWVHRQLNWRRSQGFADATMNA